MAGNLVFFSYFKSLIAIKRHLVMAIVTSGVLVFKNLLKEDTKVTCLIVNEGLFHSCGALTANALPPFVCSLTPGTEKSS